MKMKNIIVTTLLISLFSLSFVTKAEAVTRVRGYYKPSTGTYVVPSYRSSPNKTKLDNYSTKGNYNPYSGKAGTKSYYRY